MSWSILYPFGGVLLGIIWRTFVPYLITAFGEAVKTGEWPRFGKKFIVPPVCTLVVETLILIGLVLVTPGVFDQIRQMAFLTAIAFGVAGQESIRDLQKFLEAWSQRRA